MFTSDVLSTVLGLIKVLLGFFKGSRLAQNERKASMPVLCRVVGCSEGDVFVFLLVFGMFSLDSFASSFSACFVASVVFLS